MIPEEQLTKLLALREEINTLHDKANKAPIFESAKRTWKRINADMGTNLAGLADLCDYISQHALGVEPPRPAILTTLEAVLREIWESRFPFDNCQDPSKPLGFCSPHEGNWGKKWEDLTDAQVGLAKFSIMRYREGCAEQGNIPKYLGGKGYIKRS